MNDQLNSKMDVFEIGTRGPLFFMHIPKTAGMSMRQYLREQYHPHEILPVERWEDLRGNDREVSSYRLVRGHFRYNLRELLAPDARVLVVLRDPLRRTVSALRHLGRDPDFHHTYDTAKDLTLGEIIRHPKIMGFQRDVQARFLCASRSAAKVSAYLEEARSRHKDVDAGDLEIPPNFQLAADRLEVIDFVGITEDLGALLSTLAREMNYHPPLYFPVVNENPDRIDPLDGLTEEELDIVRKHNTVDLQLYDFAKKMLAWRNFEHAMRQMVAGGVYQVPPGSFELRMESIIPGSGWFPPERDGEQSWRWTGPGRYFTIEVPLRWDASYRFEMTFSDPRPSGPADMAVEVNDIPVPLELISEDNGYKCVFIIGQPLLASSSGLCRIQIDSGETIQLNPSDIRRLGIAVRRIDFFCFELGAAG